MGLDVGVKLIDQRCHWQPGTIAPRFVQHQPQVLAHPVDRETEVELAVDHARAAVVHLPALRGALADHTQHRLHVEAGLFTEGQGFGQALNQPGNRDLIDHLGELPGTAVAQQRDRL